MQHFLVQLNVLDVDRQQSKRLVAHPFSPSAAEARYLLSAPSDTPLPAVLNAAIAQVCHAVFDPHGENTSAACWQSYLSPNYRSGTDQCANESHTRRQTTHCRMSRRESVGKHSSCERVHLRLPGVVGHIPNAILCATLYVIGPSKKWKM